jgi:hypothetical protein
MAKPLYAIEEHLAALIDTADLLTPAEEQDFIEEFQRTLAEAVEKRDRVGQFMAHLEQQVAFASSEIERLKNRRSVYQHALERLEEYVLRTIRSLGRDAKGKYRKLEGNTITFSLAACPPSVELVDEAAVPSDYKVFTLKISGGAWESFLEQLEEKQLAALVRAVNYHEISVDKRLVKAAITAGDSVAGASLTRDKTWLKRT